MVNGHDDTLMKRVATYGTGDPGIIGLIPMMTMVAIKFVKVSKTEHGIELPPNSQDEYQTPKGRVLAVGPMVLFLKVGDLVRCPAETLASKMWVGDADWVLVREDQLFGIDVGSEKSEFVAEARRGKMADTGRKVIIAPEG